MEAGHLSKYGLDRVLDLVWFLSAKVLPSLAVKVAAYSSRGIHTTSEAGSNPASAEEASCTCLE